MNAAGARALLSAKCPSHRRLLARPPPASAVHGCSQRRSFRASAPVLSRADEPPALAEDKKPNNPPPPPEANPAPTPPAEETTTPPAKDTPNEPPKSTSVDPPKPTPEATTAATSTTYKEALRSQGYGSARNRANRVRSEEQLPPPFSIPASFLKDQVSLYESRVTEPWNGGVITGLPPLSLEDREAVLDYLAAELDKVALSQLDLPRLKRMVILGEGGLVEGLEGLVERVKGVHAAAYWSVLAVAHRGEKEESVPTEALLKTFEELGMGQEAVEMMTRVRPDGGGMVGKLKGHWEERGGEELVRWVWKVKGEGVELSAEAQKWLAGAKVDGKVEALDAGPMARRPEAEYTACVELLAAVRAEMAAESPGSRLRELQRPVTILSMLNCKGKKAAMRVVDEVATEVQADVVHLTAAELAHMLGGHLGQNMHWSRGSVSMLGYAAAEMNGRSVSRADADGETEVGIHVTLPPRLRSFLSTKESSSSGVGAYDGRWEELKMMQALESLVGAADLKRGGSQPDRPLLVHVHDFVEISALHDGIIAKLRHIVDRMWQRGRKVVLVGSSGSDINKSGQWRDQLVELGRDGHHIIPFHAAESSFTTILSNQDNLDENLLNITKMLQSMLGPSAKIDFGTTKTHLTSMASEYPLWHNVYDAQWVYHLASLMIGGRTPPLKTFTLEDLRYGMSIMSDRNKQWTAINPAVRPPYFSPLFTPRASMPGFMPSNPEEWSADHMSGQGPSPSSSKDYDQHEKKLLSGLINAKDIHTTFNDIIVPPETKESLIGLTSLSLVRPDAFSYGVLKTERIPGCLLYGPPGTGKTLLAKAVAKESGANMLEVSAASINDMWLGQSEKNVRALFSLARKMAPMVIFLDEADALLGARHNAPGRNAHRETITQFLREWDGLSDMRAFIMVATNRPFDLDEAVLRRLPRKILVDLPLTKERESILRVMLREESLAEDVDLAKLAVETDLYSGSDLKNLCVSAAMEAVREEVRQKEAWKGEEEFVFPEKRILTRAHFDKGMREISASISEDMESLKAIRKFDAQYGDAGRKRRGRKTMGFEVVEEKKGSEGVRVRQVAG